MSSCVETVMERNRLEASTSEEDGSTLTEEHEDIQDDAPGTKTLLCSSRKTHWTSCWPWTPTAPNDEVGEGS